MIETLLLLITFLLLVLIGLVFFLISRSKKTEPNELKGVLSTVWTELGLGEKIGTLSKQAEEMQKNYRSFEQMLRIPTERGYFGELGLETILKDQLPPEMFDMRIQVLDGKTPDAHIRSTVGLICVDSKFPLDNYQKMLELRDPEEKKSYKNLFRRDIEIHLSKIAKDYVCPEKGSAEFAFAYIPVESVAYYLLTEESETLQKYIRKGVQVVSPLTLSQRIELIKSGVTAQKLSENAQKVQNEVNKIANGFKKVDESWKILYDSHIKNLSRKADELDEAYKKLRDEFNNIRKGDLTE